MRARSQILALVIFALALLACQKQDANETFAQFKIIYLTNNVGNGFTSVASIQSELGAKVVTDWESAEAALTTGDVDALLVSPGMFSQVDKEVLLLEYKRGLTVVFFNTYAEEIRDLLHEGPFDEGWTQKAAQPMVGNFYISVWRMTRCENGEPAYRDLAHPCDPSNSYGGGIIESSQSSSAGELNTKVDFERFLQTLAFELGRSGDFSQQ